MINIAICDDEPNIRAYLASLIRAQSCPCEIVEYASAGDCLADRREIDLLFLDIELAPDRPDGMALARKLRERAAGTQPLLCGRVQQNGSDADKRGKAVALQV